MGPDRERSTSQSPQEWRQGEEETAWGQPATEVHVSFSGMIVNEGNGMPGVGRWVNGHRMLFQNGSCCFGPPGRSQTSVPVPEQKKSRKCLSVKLKFPAPWGTNVV